jgi:zinc transporter ZupT
MIKFDFNLTYLVWVLLIGGFSAVSLPLGAIFGIKYKPSSKTTALMAAFGAGALLTALTVELIAPTALEMHHEHADPFHLIFLIIGCIIGGLVFITLNIIINNKGGFLRKQATTIGFLNRKKQSYYKKLIKDLGKVSILRNLPLEHIHHLIDLIEPVSFEDETVLFDQGDQGESLYIIQTGQIALFRENKPFKTLAKGAIVGEIALLTNAPRSAKAVATNNLTALKLSKENFSTLCAESSELNEATRKLACSRLDELAHMTESKLKEAKQWSKSAIEAIRRGKTIPTKAEIIKAKSEYQGSPLAIWLGILLDGIPESLVIGFGFLALLIAKNSATYTPTFLDLIPYTLIAGLFLSNLPEAFSSSVVMNEQGYKSTKIVLLWFSILIITMLGAGLGYFLGGYFSHSAMLFLEGLAAGAMLTMIASTMLPEAVHMGGPNSVGLSTLFGFLAAVAFKLFE